MAEEFETIELEYSEDDILYYLEDEDGTEIGFAIEEDGDEVEYFYEGFDAEEYEIVEEIVEAGQAVDEPVKKPAAEKPAAKGNGPESQDEPKEHGYLYKMASIAGYEGNKTRKKAEEKLDVVRGKAEEQYGKAKKVASEQAGKAKSKADDMDLGITREGVQEMTSDLNSLAKEGAETAKELKEAYDDIMENFGFLVPKKIRRRMP